MGNDWASQSTVALFFSYSHNDGLVKQIVERAVSACNNRDGAPKLQMFIDERSILPGEVWRGEIEDGLQRTEIFLPCITPNYLLSRECAREFNLFEAFRRESGGQRVCVPLFWGDVPAAYLNLPDFQRDVYDAVRDINGYDASAFVKSLSAEREQLIVSELSSKLCVVAEKIVRARNVGSGVGESPRHRGPLPGAWSVGVDGFGDNKIAVIKVVRDISHLELRRAKEAVERGQVFVSGVDYETARGYAREIEMAGGTACISPA